MKILICGAGIAGLTSAYWLSQAGHECTVIEKSPTIRTEGYMIDFGGTGWDVANMMGLIPALEARQHHVEAINFMRANHKIAASINARKLYATAGVADKFMVLNRRDVVEALYLHVKDMSRICFDMTITSIQQSGGTAHVTFSNGTSDEYDLLIGADGIHSQVRRLVFGEETQFAKYMGYHFAIFIIPQLHAELQNGYNMYLEPGVQVSAYPIADQQWMIFVTLKNDNPSLPSSVTRGELIKRYLESMGWMCSDIADKITDDTYIFYDTITQIVNPHWSQGRVVLVGDAAHCPTLVSGQGASMAMAGSYFLSKALSEYNNINDALLAYDKYLRPHIDRIQEKARNFAPNFVPDKPWKIWLIQTIMKFSDAPFVKSLIGKQFAVQSIFPSE